MRLIDADALLEDMRKNSESYFADDFAKYWVDQQPTIDAVKVVRCKDCKHRDPEDHKCDCGHDIMWQLPRADEWFCADGERGEADDETYRNDN